MNGKITPPKIQAEPDAIKMLAYNPLTRQIEEITPDNQVAVWDMIPLYWVPGLNRYASIPGTTGSSAYGDWLKLHTGQHDDDNSDPHRF